MLAIYLGAKSTEVANEVAHTRGAHVRYKFLEELYKDHLEQVEDVEGDDMQAKYH